MNMNIKQQQFSALEENKSESRVLQKALQYLNNHGKHSQEKFPGTNPYYRSPSIQEPRKTKANQPKDSVLPTPTPLLEDDSSRKKPFIINELLGRMQADLQHPVHCSNHPRESAIAVCTKEKIYLCINCIKKDECPDGSLIPRDKLKDYLEEEVAKLKRKENEILRRSIFNAEVTENMFIQINPLLVDIVTWETSKQQCINESKEKQNSTTSSSDNIPDRAHPKQIKVFNDIEGSNKYLEDLEIGKEVMTEAKNRMTKKLLTFLEEEPTKIFVDNSLKELNEVFDHKFCQSLELCFKPGFNNRDGLYAKLKEFGNLENLSLQNLAAFKNLCTQDLSELANICQNLRHLNLDFAYTQKPKDENSGLVQFFQELRTSTRLKTLQLSFRESSFISEGDILQLCNLISNAPNLKNLALEFEKCEQATDIAIRTLFNTIKHRSLQELSLNFLNCPQLTEESIKQFDLLFYGDEIFRSLTLKFGHSEIISCTWLQLLSHFLQNFRVSKLTLHFESCPMISYGGVNHLLAATGSIQGLKELNLSFIDCRRFEGVRVLKNLSKCVKKQQNLKAFSFRLQKCPRFSLKGLDKFKNEIKDVPFVQVNCSNK